MPEINLFTVRAHAFKSIKTCFYVGQVLKWSSSSTSSMAMLPNVDLLQRQFQSLNLCDRRKKLCMTLFLVNKRCHIIAQQRQTHSKIDGKFLRNFRQSMTSACLCLFFRFFYPFTALLADKYPIDGLFLFTTDGQCVFYCYYHNVFGVYYYIVFWSFMIVQQRASFPDFQLKLLFIFFSLSFCVFFFCWRGICCCRRCQLLYDFTFFDGIINNLIANVTTESMKHKIPSICFYDNRIKPKICSINIEHMCMLCGCWRTDWLTSWLTDWLVGCCCRHRWRQITHNSHYLFSFTKYAHINKRAHTHPTVQLIFTWKFDADNILWRATESSNMLTQHTILLPSF